MPREYAIGRAGPAGPLTRRSEFSRTDPNVGLRPGEQPRLIKPLPQGQTGAVDPREFVNNQFEQFKDRYRQTYKRLRKQHGNDVEAFNRDLARLDADADQYEAKHATAIAQIAYLQKAVESGLDAEAGRRAMERAAGIPSPVLPSARAGQRGRFTPSEFKSYVAAFEEAAEPAIKRPLFSRNYADPTVLKDQYFIARAQFAYDTDMNVDERRAFDLAWDQAMGSDSKTLAAWKKAMKEDPDLFTSRTYDAKLLELAADKARGTTTPLGKSVAKQKKPTYPTMGGWNPWVGRVKSRPAATETPKRQFNKKTGQTRISYDGGKTWQIE